MPAIGQTRYNSQGELMAPPNYRILSLRNRVNGPPSFERGRYHYFEFRADNEYDLLRKLRTFLGRLDAAGGEILTYRDEPEGQYLGRPSTRIIARILYIV